MSKEADVAMRFGADIDPLRRDLKKASVLVGNFGKEVRSGVNDFSKYGAGAAVAGAAVVTALYVKQAPVIDSLAKTSDALGIATEKLQTLHHIAELNGVSADAMSKGLQKMEVRLGEAARKGGASADALKEVGVNIDDILKLSPDQQIQTLANAFGQVENQSIKASLATDLFGRDGIKMMKVLTQLRKEGVEPTSAKLDELGITISRVDAAKVEAANDAIFKSQQVMSSVANTITIELAPYIEELANQFIEVAKESGGFGDEVRAAIEGALKFIGKLGDVLQGLKVVFKGIELVAMGFGAAVISMFELQMTAVTKFADGAIFLINKIIDGLNKIPKVDIAHIDPISDSAFMDGLHSLGDTARNKVVEVRDELDALAMTEMPSAKIEAFLNTVKDRAQEAGLAVANVVSPSSSHSGDNVANDSDGSVSDQSEGGFSDQEAEAYQGRVDTIRSRYLTEAELLREHKANLAIIEQEFNDADDSQKAEWAQIKENAEKDHFNRMMSVRQQNYTGIQGLLSKQFGWEAAETAGALQSIFSSFSGHSKKMFKLNQLMGVANASVDMARGIAAGVRLGWPAGVPAVAWAAANGAKALSAIKGASFSGGSKVSASSAVGSTPSVAAPQISKGETGGGTIYLDGISRGENANAGELIDKINEGLRNGYKLEFQEAA